MLRDIALGLLMLLTGIDVVAQAPMPSGPAVRLGVGLSSADYTCSVCQIDAETGVSAFVAATRSLGGILSAGMEASVVDASSGIHDFTILGALVTGGVHGGPRMPVWGSLGLGWVFFTGDGPSSSGPGLSVRAGVDLPVGARVALTPYAGYLTMLGHDGPHHVQDINNPGEGVATRVSSLQLGVAASLRL